MILVLLGPDAYRKRVRRKAAIAAFGVPTHQSLRSGTGQASDLVKLDAESLTIQALDDALLSLGLFATKMVVVIPDVGDLSKTVASRLVELLPQVSDPPSPDGFEGASTLLILEADKLDQRTELAKALKKFPTEPFELLRGVTLDQWISDQSKGLGVSIDPDARRLLIERVGADSWRLRSELEKLATAALSHPPFDKGGQGDLATETIKPKSPPTPLAQRGESNTPTITQALIKDLTLATTSPAIFALTDALVASQPAKARIALAKLLASGEAPLGILGMLGFHLRTLTLVKDALETHVPAKLHPFVVQKHQPLARRLDWPTLADWYEQLVAYDTAVKTGTMELVLALELMVHELSS